MDTSNFKEVFESPKVKTLTAQVAALELEVVSLRSVMADVIKAHGYGGGTPTEVLSTPFTPTALNDLVEKVERRTIEQCAEMLKSKHSHEVAGATHHAGNWHAAYDYHMTRQAVLSETLDAIRALPTGQIKLEGLL